MFHSEIGFLEKVDPLPHPREILSRNSKVSGNAGPHGKEDRLRTLFEELVKLPNLVVTLNLNPVLAYDSNFCIDQLARKPIGGHAQPELPSRITLGLKDSDVMTTSLPEVVGGCQTCRTRPYYRHALAGRRGNRFIPFLSPEPRVVHRGGFLDGIDCHRRLPKSPPTHRLTRPVANVTADGRKRDPFPYHGNGLRILPKGHVGDVAGDIDSRRASESAGGDLPVVLR